jgi:hypothetical protein
MQTAPRLNGRSMLVDRPTARASLRWRALIWAAGMVGLGILVLAVQQLRAEPAGADTPGLVDGAADGVVATVDQVAEPVPALDPRPTEAPGPDSPHLEAAAPVVEAAAPVVEAAAPVVEPLGPVVEAAEPVREAAAPVVEAAAPVVEPVSGTAPVVEAAAPVIARLAGATAPLVTPLAEAVAPVVEAAAPVVVPVVDAAVPVVDPVVQAVPPVLEAITPEVAPVVGAAGPIVDSMPGMGPGPRGGHTELTPSSPADAPHPDAAARRLPAPIAARSANAAVPVLEPTRGATTGQGDTPSGVPPGPLPWAAPSGGPGGLGESRSGGAGPSSLTAVLGGGVPGPGPAPGGVVHDRAARLTSLVHGPGRLPG